jgi:hypothetical protein
VCGLGRIRHREFAMGAGEMSRQAFTGFLQLTLGHAAACCRDGAIAYVCMDWRHLGELLAAGQAVFSELKNLCVWNKTNGGMGSFYRSKHELVLVFKVGNSPHTNTFGLGDGGRYRTNVWDYAGVNTLRSGCAEELAMHPTVKPVALAADAIKDCSRRGETVLDPFGGSGTRSHIRSLKPSGGPQRTVLLRYDGRPEPFQACLEVLWARPYGQRHLHHFPGSRYPSLWGYVLEWHLSLHRLLDRREHRRDDQG